VHKPCQPRLSRARSLIASQLNYLDETSGATWTLPRDWYMSSGRSPLSGTATHCARLHWPCLGSSTPGLSNAALRPPALASCCSCPSNADRVSVTNTFFRVAQHRVRKKLGIGRSIFDNPYLQRSIKEETSKDKREQEGPERRSAYGMPLHAPDRVSPDWTRFPDITGIPVLKSMLLRDPRVWIHVCTEC
jgi:hypothetical protein